MILVRLEDHDDPAYDTTERAAGGWGQPPPEWVLRKLPDLRTRPPN